MYLFSKKLLQSTQIGCIVGKSLEPIERLVSKAVVQIGLI